MQIYLFGCEFGMEFWIDNFSLIWLYLLLKFWLFIYMRFLFLLLLFIISYHSLAQDGFLYTYYPSGKVDGMIFFANDVLEGTSYWYYENGNIKASKTYTNGKLNGIWREFYESGLVKEEILIKDGIRDGLSQVYYDNGGLKEVRSYDMGVLTKLVQVGYDSLYVAPVEAYQYGNTQNNIKKNHDLFICEGADICPKPVGGMPEIITNLKYPEHAMLYGLEGYVTVVAKIDKEGNAKEVNVLRGLGLGCDEAAIEAVKNTQFLPGQINEIAVESNVLFKIPFVLTDEVHKYYTSPADEYVTEGGYRPDSLSSSNTPIDTVKTERKVFKNFSCDLDVCPRPKEGIKTIIDNLDIPAVAKRERIGGAVSVSAEVDEYGFVIDTKVVNGIGYGIDGAVERAILRTQFEPGLLNGKLTSSKVLITVPIIPEEEHEDEE